MHQVPFIAMIDVASLYGTTPMFQWHFKILSRSKTIGCCFMIPPTGRTVMCHAMIFWPCGRLRGIEESVYGSRNTCPRVSAG